MRILREDAPCMGWCVLKDAPYETKMEDGIVAGWMIAVAPGFMETWVKVRRGGKSGLHRARWWVTPTARFSGKGQCHRKQTAPADSVRQGKGETAR